MVSSPGYAGGRVAACRLEEYVGGEDIGELFADERLVVTVGHHDDVLLRHKGQNTVVAPLEQGAAGTEKIDELFGTGFA